MAKVSFYLKNPKAVRKSAIYLNFNYDSKRLQAPTGWSIEPKYWNARKGEVKHQFSHLDLHRQYNDFLSSISDIILNYYREKKTKGTSPHPDSIKRHLLNELNKPEEEEKPTGVIEVFDLFIQSVQVVRKPATIKRFNTLRNYLIEFDQSPKESISFDGFDMAFYDRFTQWLMARPNKNAHGKTEVGMLNDSISKYISTLKTFLDWALTRGYHTNTTFTEYEAKRNSRNEIVKLTLQEVEALEALDVSANKRLSKAKDLFLFGIFTGQRWSDIEAYDPKDIIKTDKGIFWKFRAVKTEKPTTVPFMGYCAKALPILEKYGYQLPKVSSQQFNRTIKEVGELAGITDPVSIERKSGNKLIELRQPKFKFMASHMARRTAVSVLLQKGVPPTVIMKLTGHRDLRTLLKYEDTTTDELSKALTEAEKME